MTPRLASFEYESVVDAEGVSCVLFISGCKHSCSGCHSPQTHDFSYGIEINDDVIESINLEIDKRPYLNALVLSGGDPMYSAKELLEIIPKLHIPNNNLWCYTGFHIEEIVKNPDMLELLKMCTFLIDGPFIEGYRDITLKFRGSSNQRIIDIKRSFSEKQLVLYGE